MARKKHPIPDEKLIPALNQTLAEFPGYCVDKWGEKEAARCRDIAGEEFAIIETDWIRRRAITLRKRAELESINGGPKRKKREAPFGAYAEYLGSDHWLSFRQSVLEFWGLKCCLCNSSKRLEVHHRTYERLGNERLSDCVCLCRKCHAKVHGQMVDGNEELNRELELWQ